VVVPPAVPAAAGRRSSGSHDQRDNEQHPNTRESDDAPHADLLVVESADPTPGPEGTRVRLSASSAARTSPVAFSASESSRVEAAHVFGDLLLGEFPRQKRVNRTLCCAHAAHQVARCTVAQERSRPPPSPMTGTTTYRPRVPPCATGSTAWLETSPRRDAAFQPLEWATWASGSTAGPICSKSWSMGMQMRTAVILSASTS
jgi:hypothetical protein